MGALLLVASATDPAGALGRYTTEFRLEECTFSNLGDENPYLNLTPGYQLVLEGEEDGVAIEVQVTVLDEIETISFETMNGVPLTVDTRVVEEREIEDGEVQEVSLNWFARCVETSDIFYFGEEEDGVVGWRAGENGAFPGMIMPGTFLLGSRYFQEQAPEVALDRAEHVSMGLEVTVPAGTFSDCVRIRETNPLEPGSKELKVYCPGVGIVIDEEAKLVDFGFVEH